MNSQTATLTCFCSVSLFETCINCRQENKSEKMNWGDEIEFKFKLAMQYESNTQDIVNK